MSFSGAPVRTETQISAGGAAFRQAGPVPEVVLVSVGNPPRWQLPKGLIDEGETPEKAAVREVREEAGIDARAESLIEKVEYWYQAKHRDERIRYHKFVHFFLMRYVAGDASDHDAEVNEARWFPVDQAVEHLAFRSERAIVEKAASMLEAAMGGE